MFGGKPRRNVNLGGRKLASREDALKNAETLRAQREQSRKNERSARIIQNAWRIKVMITKLRYEFALLCLNGFHKTEEFAYILPALKMLTREQQLRVVELFANSELSLIYYADILQRLLCLWDTPDTALHRAGYKVLKNQAHAGYSSTSTSINFETILNYCYSSWLEPETATFLFTINPSVGLEALLYLYAHHSDKAATLVQLEAIRPYYAVSRLPDVRNTSWHEYEMAIYSVFIRVAHEAKHAYPLISLILNRLPTKCIYGIDEYIVALCDNDILRALANRSISELAKYVIALKMQSPKNRSYVLQKQSLFIGPVRIWSEYLRTKDEYVFHYAVEAMSFHLLVSLDVEIQPIIQDLRSIAKNVCDRCLQLLLYHKPGETVKLFGVDVAIIRLVRQIYHRDSRLKMFPEDFWLPKIPLQQLISAIHESTYSKTLDSDYVRSPNSNVNSGSSGENLMDPESQNSENTRSTPYSEELKGSPLVLNPVPSARILELTPFFVPFKTRAELFYAFIDKDKECVVQDFPLARLEHDINREDLLNEAELLFLDTHDQLKTGVRIRMISDGVPEAGVDGGGIMKDLLSTICEETLGPKRFIDNPSFKHPNDMTDEDRIKYCFIETNQRYLTPNPALGENRDYMLNYFRFKFFFLGLTIGKCLYEKLLLNVEFSPTFLSKWHWNSYAPFNELEKNSVDDLSLLDPSLHKSLIDICLMPPENVQALGLDFTIPNCLGETCELIHKGHLEPVTAFNRLDYAWRVANFKLNVATRPQTMWFVYGIGHLINLKWLNMFNPAELNKIIGGALRPLDVEDLRRWTQVSGFPPRSKAPQFFWEILSELDLEQTADFLRFVTAVPRGPLLGFVDLNPRFGIRCAGDDQNRLPTAGTCFNLLKLPNYTTKEAMREKLLYAISASARFDLS